MNKIKRLLAQWQLQRLSTKSASADVSFPGDLMKPQHVLVCLPSRLRELTLVKQLLPKITALFKPADITLLALPGVKVADMYPRKGFQILNPSTDQLTWAGLPKSSYLDSLQQYKYDTVLDLNLEKSFFTSAILLSFPKAVRIGRGNHLGVPFYNLEIKTRYLRDERNIYRSLLETLGTITNRPNRGPSGEQPNTEAV
ncbi:MAG: hypothetical protein V3T31_01145 [candidate division Zixibacteria bacterium]